MVERQLRHRDIADERVLEAMARVPWELFVPRSEQRRAYADAALPIGHGQTISQPYMVAVICQAAEVREGDSILDIGTGSGYQAAVLAELGANVHTIERIPELAERARARLVGAGYENVDVHVGDGSLGVPEHAPYDAVVVTCAPNHVPRALVEQTRNGGRIVIPVGPAGAHELYVLEKEHGQLKQRTVLPVRFVPMTGEANRPR